jgi:predicted transcriptional regulator
MAGVFIEIFFIPKHCHSVYTTDMINTLKEMLQAAAKWPEEMQEELADAAREIAQGLSGEYHPTREELAGIDRGLDDAEHQRFATKQEVRAAFNRFRGA